MCVGLADHGSAAVAPNLRNFAHDRGAATGLLKALFGLAGGVLVRSLPSPTVDSLIDTASTAQLAATFRTGPTHTPFDSHTLSCTRGGWFGTVKRRRGVCLGPYLG